MAETTLPLFAPGTLDARIDDPTLSAAVAATMARAADERWSDRLHDRDVTLWSSDPAVQERIANRLGWLDLPVDFSLQVPALEAFGETTRDAGFTAAIVAGMGGSSLAPAVIATAFGDLEDWLAIRVLDSTDPAAVAAAWEGLDPLATLFIVGSKSGTTTETLAFRADAWERFHDALRAHGVRMESPGEFMVAVTDPGKSLAAIPHQDDMRGVFLNPESVGGRYSALSYVGLLPASLGGIDLDPFMASAVGMHARCVASDPTANPGVALGVVLGALAAAGRDKLTLVVDPAIGSLGAWLEQLVAESTGKAGVGIVPVDREPLGAPGAYGEDRVFVRIALDGAAAPASGPDGSPADALLDALAAAGHPVLRFTLTDPIDLAAEFLRWEVATAIAGIVLGRQPVRRAERDRVEGEHEAGPRGARAPRRLPPRGAAGLWERHRPLRGHGAPPDRRRRQRRRGAAATPGARPTGRLPRPGRVRRSDGGSGRGDRSPPWPPPRRHRHRDDRRLRAALPPLHRAAPQGRPGDWLVPPAHERSPGRPAGPRQALHLRPAGRCAGARRHGGARGPRPPVLRVHLGADVDAGLAALDAAVAEALRQ